MDDKKIIQERLAKIKEKTPAYSGIIIRHVEPTPPDNSNDYAVFGSVVHSRKSNKKITLEDVIDSVMRYRNKCNERSDLEAIILLQYYKHKGMVLKYWHTNTGVDSIYLIGELEPNKDHFDLLL